MSTGTTILKLPTIKVNADGAIATVTLDIPTKRNAITPDVHRDLEEVWTRVSDLEGIRCVIFTGAGDTFTIGGDVEGMIRKDFKPASGLFGARRLIGNFLNVPQPVIAAVNGDCVGLGASLALMSDFVVMSERARIGDPHVRVGLVAGDGGVAIWPLLLGLNRAKAALMLGKLYSGKEAYDLGLAHEVVPPDGVMVAARKLAEEIIALPPLAVQWTKVSMNKHLRHSVEQSFDVSAALDVLSLVSDDHQRAAQAFLDKKKAVYEGN